MSYISAGREYADQTASKLARPDCGIGGGATIMTMDGMIPVEFLSIGDRVITRDGGMRKVKAITPVTTTRAVKISASALGVDAPEDDMLVGRDQMLLIRDWRAKAMFGRAQAMVAAKDLVDGEYISEASEMVTLYQIAFDGDHVIYAGGLELATASLEAVEKAA